MGETEGREFISVAVIELDPIHPQIRLAHDHPEDREGETTLRYHPAVLRLHRSYAVVSMVVLRYHRRLDLGHVLGQSNELVGDLAAREDLHLILVMK